MAKGRSNGVADLAFLGVLLEFPEALLVLFLVVLLVVLWKTTKLPEWAYPATAWNHFADWVDGIYEGFDNPLFEKQKRVAQQGTDKWLGAVYEWLTDNTPRPPREKDEDFEPANPIFVAPAGGTNSLDAPIDGGTW